MSEPTGVIHILLGDAPAGDLVVYPDDRTEFALDHRYVAMYPRPVLGQVFEDDLHATHRSRMQLSPFFSNLLPEERIRELVASQIGVSPSREARLLAYLGEDLPGAVRAIPEGELPTVSSAQTEPRDQAHLHPIKFSLAGAQPKLSMLLEGDGLTFPATGRGGNHLVKMPGSKYKGVPENEFVTMSWAGASGVVVPSFWLEPVSKLRNVPPEMSEANGNAYVVARFDRPAPGRRIHIEDFAQVLGLYPTYDGKYKRANYETLAAIVLRQHPASFDEFIRRLVFVVLSANADAHVKNWSFWYPDGVNAQLAPAYDLVSTVEFIGEDTLALNIAGSKAWEDVKLSSFESLAKRVGADPVAVARLVKDSTARTLDAWSRWRPSASLLLQQRIEAHWKRLPLAKGE